VRLDPGDWTRVPDWVPRRARDGQKTKRGGSTPAPHTTAALLLGEDDAELRRDLVRAADRWLRDCGPFSHIRKYNPNAEAHILSAFGGNGLVVAVENGRLDLGAYQNALLLELDGPKEREIRAAALVGRPGGEKGAML